MLLLHAHLGVLCGPEEEPAGLEAVLLTLEVDSNADTQEHI